MTEFCEFCGKPIEIGEIVYRCKGCGRMFHEACVDVGANGSVSDHEHRSE